MSEPVLRILHTNVFHGKLDDAREAAIEELRAECDLYFDSGDAIKAGNLAIPLRAEEVWSRLARLRCSASVPGNRESHLIKAALAKKLEGATHPLICANMRSRDGETVFPPHLVIDANGIRVGVIGVMVPMVTKQMKTQAASAYLWQPAIPAAIEQGEQLRPQVDCLIALTHIGLRQDRELATKWPHFDLILGGHSHDVLTQPEVIGHTAICQTGSHGRNVGRYIWTKPEGLITYELIPLPKS